MIPAPTAARQGCVQRAARATGCFGDIVQPPDAGQWSHIRRRSASVCAGRSAAIGVRHSPDVVQPPDVLYPPDVIHPQDEPSPKESSLINFVLPQINCVVGTQNYGRFVISPLENGYGTTLGNALRRVFLSSLDGAAVTSLRVADVQHEFSTIPGVREDMMLFILNVKQIRFAMPGASDLSRLSQAPVPVDTDSLADATGVGAGILPPHGAWSSRPLGSASGLGPMRLHLSIRGQGVVTAGDILCPPEIEIVNPELYLFTVDDPDAELDIEMTVERGRGYSPSEERGKLPIGELPVDAIFSPIRKVNYDVTPARVGQMTNYDTLTLEIWTDGTLRPQAALAVAADLMIRHLVLFAGVEHLEAPAEPLGALADVDQIGVYASAADAHQPDAAGVASAARPDALSDAASRGRAGAGLGAASRRAGGGLAGSLQDVPIEELDLTVRVYNCLKRTGITKVSEVLAKMEKGTEEMLAIRNFGIKSLVELGEKLVEKGYLRAEDLADLGIESEQ